MESQIEQTATTVLLVDNGPGFRGTTGSSGSPPAFASPVDFTDSAGNLQETASGTNDSGDSYDPRHTGGLNILFTDGHVKWMTKDALLSRPGALGLATTSSDYSTDAKFLWNRF